MKPQRTTVLDTARTVDELKRFIDFRIEDVRSGISRRILFLKFRGSDEIVKYSTGTKSSYIGLVASIPEDAEKTLPGIESYHLSDIRQVNYDRIIECRLEKKDRLGKISKAILILELMPNIGDACFVDIDYNVKSTLRKKREKLYKYPDPLKKPTVLNITEGQFKALSAGGRNPLNEIYGLNDRDTKNLSGTEIPHIDELYYDLKEYVDEAIKPGPAWIIVSNNDYIGYSLVQPKLESDETAIEIKSALSMYEQYHRKVAGSIDETKHADDLKKTVKSRISKTKKKINRIRKELGESKKAGLYKMYGEMILSNIGKIKKGADSVTLDSLYDESDDKITIKLDPSKSPSANAQSYFKKSKKASGSGETLRNRLSESETELENLEEIFKHFPEKPELAEQKLASLGFPVSSESKGAARKPVERRKPYRVFSSSSGWEILIGKSNKDNDELTFHIASKDDFWFHAWQAAGSHTVLRLPDKSSKPDKQTLLEAASLAAYYSKAKHSSKVPVIYTQVKYVRKPRKFPPGKVLVEREKQLMVKPANPDLFLLH